MIKCNRVWKEIAIVIYTYKNVIVICACGCTYVYVCAYVCVLGEHNVCSRFRLWSVKTVSKKVFRKKKETKEEQCTGYWINRALSHYHPYTSHNNNYRKVKVPRIPRAFVSSRVEKAWRRRRRWRLLTRAELRSAWWHFTMLNFLIFSLF